MDAYRILFSRCESAAKGTLFGKSPLKYSWNESDHPRDGDGKFSEKAEQQKYIDDKRNKLMDFALSQFKDDAIQQDVSMSFGRATMLMSIRALDELARTVKQIEIASDDSQMSDIHQSLIGEPVPKGMSVAGFWDNDTQTLVLGAGSDSQTRRHVFIHEMAHAIDLAGKHSRTPGWKEAWESEITGGALSEYATVSPAEGFAEFARMVYSPESRKIAKQRFPKCHAYWVKRDLLDADT